MKKNGKKYKDTMVTFRFEARDMKEMHDIMELANCNEVSAVVNGLTLYKMLLQDRKKKRRFFIENRWGNSKEFIL